MVQETLAPGASVAIIARRHGVNANQLFSWRRQYRRGVLELVTPRGLRSPLWFRLRWHRLMERRVGVCRSQTRRKTRVGSISSSAVDDV